MQAIQSTYYSVRSALELYFEPLLWFERLVVRTFEEIRVPLREFSRFLSQALAYGRLLGRPTFREFIPRISLVFEVLRYGPPYPAYSQAVARALEDAYKELKDTEKSAETPLALLQMAELHAQQLHFMRAEDFVRRAIDIAKETRSQLLLAAGWVTLGWISQIRNETSKAIEYYLTAIRFQSEETSQIMASAYLNLGAIFMEKSHLEAAKAYLIKAIQLNEVTGRERQLTEGYARLALIFEIQGESELAREFLHRAAKGWQKRPARQIALTGSGLPDELALWTAKSIKPR